MLALLALAVLARRLEFTLGRLTGVSLDTSLHFVAVALLGAGGAALTAGAAAILGLLFHPRMRRYPMPQRLIQLVWNGGMFALMQLGGGAVYDLAGGRQVVYPLWAWQAWALALAWIVVYHLVNALLGYPAYLLTHQVTLRDVLAQDPNVFLAELATLPAGVLLLAMYRAEGLAGLVLMGAGLAVITALVRRLVNTSQRLDAQLKATTTLNQVGQALSASLDLDKVIELLHHHTMQVMNSRTLFIALYEADKQLVHYPLVVEDGERYPPTIMPFQPGQGLTPLIIATRQPQRLNSPEDIARMSARHLATGTGVRMHSYLGVPMIARDQVIGVISVQSPLRDAFSEDDLHTLTTLAQQAAIAIDNSRLVRDLAARERMKQELEIARRTQLSLLPQSVPSVPGLDIAGVSIPAVEVGGDFYAYHHVGDRLGIAIGDVSGKGMPAALLMALSAGVLEVEAPRAASASEVLAGADRALRPHTWRNRLNVACCYVMADPPSAVFDIASAGMPAPLLRRRDGQVEWLDTHGLPLGVPGAPANAAAITQRLAPGDVLILTSDGILEAQDAHGEMFSFERLAAAAAGAPAGRGAQAILDYTLEQMRAFIQPRAPHDDVTMVVVRVGDASPAR